MASTIELDALFAAAQNGDVDRLRTLLPLIEDINQRNGSMNALHAATLFGNVDAASLLLDAGADINYPDVEYYSPLILASAGGNLAIVQMLLDRRALIESATSKGETALGHAVCSKKDNRVALVRILLEAGANANARDGKFESMLMMAARADAMEAAALLLDHGADQNAINGDGKTAQDIALEKNSHNVLACLVARSNRDAINTLLAANALNPRTSEIK